MVPFNVNLVFMTSGLHILTNIGTLHTKNAHGANVVRYSMNSGAKDQSNLPKKAGQALCYFFMKCQSSFTLLLRQR